jgi:hypothetical protein
MTATRVPEGHSENLLGGMKTVLHMPALNASQAGTMTRRPTNLQDIWMVFTTKVASYASLEPILKYMALKANTAAGHAHMASTRADQHQRFA